VFTRDLAGVRAELNAIDAAQAGAALGTFSGEIYADTPAIAARAGGEFARLVGNRMTDARSDRLESGERWHGANVWTQAIGSFGDVENTAAAAGHDHHVSGLAIGVDATPSPHSRIGIAAGWSSSEAKQHRTRSRVEGDSYHLGAYASVGFGTGFLDAQASYAHHDLDVTRTLVTGMSNRIANGDTAANEVRGSLKLGTNVGTKDLDVRPFASLGYVRVDQHGLTERDAGDAGLQVGKSRFEALTGSLGFELQGNVGADGRIHPFADVVIAHDFGRDGWAVTNRLIGGGRAFRITGVRPGRTAGIGNLGITGNLGSVQFRIGYGLELRKRTESHAVSGGLTLRW